MVIKSDKHLYNNAKGPGLMSTIDIIDSSGEIRLSAFGPYVNQLFDLIEVTKSISSNQTLELILIYIL